MEAAGKGGGEDKLSIVGSEYNFVQDPVSCDMAAAIEVRGTKPTRAYWSAKQISLSSKRIIRITL